MCGKLFFTMALPAKNKLITGSATEHPRAREVSENRQSIEIFIK